MEAVETADKRQLSSSGSNAIMIFVVGACSALLIANLYFAQPLIAEIARDLGLSQSLAGSIISASQFGYGFGLFLIVPLADKVRNKRLVLICSSIVVIGTIGIATANSAVAFLISASLVGIFSSAAQVLIPYLSHVLSPKNRGKILGAVMAGVLTSVMLARPFALVVAEMWGWRSLYWIAASSTVVMGFVLALVMPERVPSGGLGYVQTMRSACQLFLEEKQVQRRTAYQAVLFALFTAFWAVVPIMLADQFGLDGTQIALFALVGIGGVLAAPIAGMVSDRDLDRPGTIAACMTLVAAFLASLGFVEALMLIPMALIAFVIDGSVQTSQTISRLVILNVAGDRRGRINAIYMTIVYFSGAIGSLAGVTLYYSSGWSALMTISAALSAIVAIAAIRESKRDPEPEREGVKGAS